MTQRPVVLTPTHPLWKEFCERLEGPEGCDFRKRDGAGQMYWSCSGGHEQPLARAILETMPGIDVDGSLALFTAHGGHCDCEILFNVEAALG